MTPETATTETIARYVQRVAASQTEPLEGVAPEEAAVVEAVTDRRVKDLLHTLRRDPLVLASRRRVALQLREDGNLPGARELQEEVVDAATETLGACAPDTLATKSELGITLSEQGELSAAANLQRGVLQGYDDLYGRERAETLEAQLDLAATLKQNGELENALALQKDVLDVRVRTLGLTHPDTVAVAGLVNETESPKKDLSKLATSYAKVQKPLVPASFIRRRCGGC